MSVRVKHMSTPIRKAFGNLVRDSVNSWNSRRRLIRKNRLQRMIETKRQGGMKYRRSVGITDIRSRK